VISEGFGIIEQEEPYSTLVDKLLLFSKILSKKERELFISLFCFQLDPLLRNRLLHKNLLDPNEMEYLSMLEHGLD